jgi:hypothetical protein
LDLLCFGVDFYGFAVQIFVQQVEQVEFELTGEIDFQGSSDWKPNAPIDFHA